MKETTLVLEGVEPRELTAEFLVAVVDAAEAEGLDVRGVSVLRGETSESESPG